MKTVLAKLPKRNFNILKFLIGHLHRHAPFHLLVAASGVICLCLTKSFCLIATKNRIAEKGSINKMFAENLGAVFGPSLMRSPKEDDMLALGPQCVVIEFMIKHPQECFES